MPGLLEDLSGLPQLLAAHAQPAWDRREGGGDGRACDGSQEAAIPVLRVWVYDRVFIGRFEDHPRKAPQGNTLRQNLQLLRQSLQVESR